MLTKKIEIELDLSGELTVRIIEFPEEFAPNAVLALVKQIAMGVDVHPYALISAVVELIQEEEAEAAAEASKPGTGLQQIIVGGQGNG